MRRYLLRFCLFSSLLLPLAAWAEPAFYRLTHGQQQHWLLGSIHVGTPALYPLPNVIDTAWEQSHALVVEVDMSQIDAAQWRGMGALTRLPEGSSLKQHLPAELYQRTLQAAARYGLTEAVLTPLRPWFAAITLTQTALAQSGFDSALGIDYTFSSRATKQHKPIIGLETLLEQLSYLASVGDQQHMLLASTLDELPLFDANLTAVIDAWQHGDEQSLTQLLKEEMAPLALQQWLEQTLLAERNHNWLLQWPALPNHSFIVVGALHLYGEQGLLALLAQQGWQVTRLTTPSHSSPLNPSAPSTPAISAY